MFATSVMTDPLMPNRRADKERLTEAIALYRATLSPEATPEWFVCAPFNYEIPRLADEEITQAVI